MTIAVILAPGFEEIEAITPIDVLRRAGFSLDVIGFSDQVTGSHGISIKADKIWQGDLSSYEMIILPGGLPGANNLRDDDSLIRALQEADNRGAYLAAICAAPKVLGRAGLLNNKTYTCYPGVEDEIAEGQHVPDLLVRDGQVITAKGAGVSLAFAYELVEVLGEQSTSLSQAMIYDALFEG